jgi:hypothetical protein
LTAGSVAFATVSGRFGSKVQRLLRWLPFVDAGAHAGLMAFWLGVTHFSGGVIIPLVVSHLYVYARRVTYRRIDKHAADPALAMPAMLFLFSVPFRVGVAIALLVSLWSSSTAWKPVGFLLLFGLTWAPAAVGAVNTGDVIRRPGWVGVGMVGLAVAVCGDAVMVASLLKVGSGPGRA